MIGVPTRMTFVFMIILIFSPFVVDSRISKNFLTAIIKLIEGSQYSVIRKALKFMKVGDDASGFTVNIGKKATLVDGVVLPKAKDSISNAYSGSRARFFEQTLEKGLVNTQRPSVFPPTSWGGVVRRTSEAQTVNNLKGLKTDDVFIDISTISTSRSSSTGVVSSLDDIAISVDDSLSSIGSLRSLSRYEVPSVPRSSDGSGSIDTTGFSYRGFPDSYYVTTAGPNGPCMRTGGSILSYFQSGEFIMDIFGTKTISLKLITRMIITSGIMLASVENDHGEVQYDFTLGMQGYGIPGGSLKLDFLHMSYLGPGGRKETYCTGVCDPGTVAPGYYCDFWFKAELRHSPVNGWTSCACHCGLIEYSDGTVYCIQCYQKTSQCTLLLPFHYYSGSGCYPTDTPNILGIQSYACGNACAQSCAPIPIWVCPYYNAVFMVNLGGSCFLSFLGSGIDPGQCCVKCPEGYYMSGCIGFALYDENPDGPEIAYSINEPTNVIGPAPLYQPLAGSIKEFGMCYLCTICVSG